MSPVTLHTHTCVNSVLHSLPTWASNVTLVSTMSLGKTRRTNVAALHHTRHSHFNTGLSREQAELRADSEEPDVQIVTFTYLVNSLNRAAFIHTQRSAACTAEL